MLGSRLRARRRDKAPAIALFGDNGSRPTRKKLPMPVRSRSKLEIWDDARALDAPRG